MNGAKDKILFIARCFSNPLFPSFLTFAHQVNLADPSFYHFAFSRTAFSLALAAFLLISIGLSVLDCLAL